MAAPEAIPAPVVVVIPTCQRPEALQRALASVCEQTLPPRSVIVSDVGGESWTAESAKDFAARHNLSTHYVVAPAGSPAGGTRNCGAADVRSDWIAFLDDDDVWDSSYLAAALPLLSDGTDLVATRLRLRRGDRSVSLPPFPPQLRAQDVLIRNPGITGSNVIIRAEAFHDLGGYDESLRAFNDLDFLVRALDRGLRLRVNQTPLVEQSIHTQGQVTQTSTARLTALEVYADRYRTRMSVGQRITVRRERHRMLKHLAPHRAGRLVHLAADVLLTSPADLRRRVMRRSTLDGGYE